MIRFKKKKKYPKYSGPSPEQAAATARAAAAAEAAKVAQANMALMAEMNAKLAEAGSKKAQPYAPTTKILSMMGDVGGGVGRSKSQEKRRRAVDASKLRIKLNPSATAMGNTPTGGTAGSSNIG